MFFEIINFYIFLCLIQSKADTFIASNHNNKIMKIELQKTPIYTNTALAKGLALSPLPITFILIIYALHYRPSLTNNYENNRYESYLIALTTVYALCYLLIAYSILFFIFYKLNQNRQLNVRNILLVGYITAFFLKLIKLYITRINWSNLPLITLELFIYNNFLIFSISTALCFALYLVSFTKKFKQ